MTIGVIFIILIGWAISSFMLYLGAGFAKIPTRTVGKSFQITAIVLVVQYLCTLLFDALNVVVPILALILGAIISFVLGWWITKNLFTTTWGKALIAILFPYIIGVAVIITFGATLFFSF